MTVEGDFNIFLASRFVIKMNKNQHQAVSCRQQGKQREPSAKTRLLEWTSNLQPV